MSEKWCLKCRFWDEDSDVPGHGICCVLSSCITDHVTHQDFGCVHWKAKKPEPVKGCDTCDHYYQGCCAVSLPKTECPHWQEKKPEDDLRERLAAHLCTLPYIKNISEGYWDYFLDAADEIIMLCGKGKGDG